MDRYSEILKSLEDKGYKHLGWLNGGITVPKGEYVRVYINSSGSSTLMVDHNTKLMYSVDQGD